MTTMVLFALTVAINVLLAGVFGETELVSVKEGDSVTLHANLVEMKKDDLIEWRFGDKGNLIAHINRAANKISISDDVLDGRFRGRLKLDNQTGDLTIRNFRIEHSGLYEVTSLQEQTKIFNISSVPVDEVKTLLVMVGDSVTLHTDLTVIQRDDMIRWKFQHQNCTIAEINRKARKVLKYNDTDKRFRHRLQLDYFTGSLTITNIGINHMGLYEVDISTISSKHTIHKTFNVTVSGKINRLSVIEGQSIKLDTGLTEIQNEDYITWMFGDIVIAEIYKTQPLLGQQLYTYDGVDDRFRDKLQLDNKTGSINITECKVAISGLYELKINSNRHTIHQRFIVTINVPVQSSSTNAVIAVIILLLFFFFITVPAVLYYRRKISKLKQEFTSNQVTVMKGVCVTLVNHAELQTNDRIQWTFGTFTKSRIAEMTKRSEDAEVSTYDGPDGIFKDRLQLEKKTGSLFISNTTSKDNGSYELKISGSGKTHSKFFVTVFDTIQSVSAMEKELVTLNTETELQGEDEITWMIGHKHIIAKASGATRKITTHHGPDGRFRDRLNLDPQTGSLTITNTATADSGDYRLQMSRSGNISFKLFSVAIFDPYAIETHGQEAINLLQFNQ